MKINNYGADHPHAVIRGRVAGSAAVGTATLTTLALVVITPTALGANTDDWNPTGLSTADIIRASASAAYNLTGIVAPSDDRIIILDNIGTFAITLKHNVTSTAANRFLCPNDADLTLQPDTNVWLQYDLTSTRWRVVGGTGSGSAIGTPGNAYSLGTLGSTPTVTFTNGTWQYGTLNGAGAVTPTISFAGFTSGKDDGLTLELTQDGTGGITPVLSGVTWLDGTPTWVTTAGTTTLVGILSRDGGSTILAGIIGGGLASSSFATPAIALGTAAAAGSAATTIRSDSTIVAFDTTVPTDITPGTSATTGSAAKAARRDHGHGASATLGAHFLVIASSHSTPLVFADLVQNADSSDLIYTT